MANDGRHTNGSQFYITLQPVEWMNKKYVAFGYVLVYVLVLCGYSSCDDLFASFREVVEGSETLKKIENLATVNDRPELACKIDDCGVFEYHF